MTCTEAIFSNKSGFNKIVLTQELSSVLNQVSQKYCLHQFFLYSTAYLSVNITEQSLLLFFKVTKLEQRISVTNISCIFFEFNLKYSYPKEWLHTKSCGIPSMRPSTFQALLRHPGMVSDTAMPCSDSFVLLFCIYGCIAIYYGIEALFCFDGLHCSTDP